MTRSSSRSGVVAVTTMPRDIHARVVSALERARFRVVDVGDADANGAVAILPFIQGHAYQVGDELLSLRSRFESHAVVALVEPGPLAARTVLAALRAGAMDAVLVDELIELVPTIRLAAEHRRIETDSNQTTERFILELGRQARELRETNLKIEVAYEDTLHALVKALDSREEATAGHSVRVTLFSLYLARDLDVCGEALLNLYRGALLHDIGKIGIPDAILLKPGKLDVAEFDTMKNHAELGRRFLANVQYLEGAIDVPFCHHEKWDGAGYPQGMSGSDIPLNARIFAVADVFDALRSKRCYKDSFPFEKCRDIILESSGNHFDPAVVAVWDAQPEAAWCALDEASRTKLDFETMLRVCAETRAAHPAGAALV